MAGDRARVRGARRRAAAHGGPAARHGRALPARVLRRPAPAHRHRPRAGASSPAWWSATSRYRRSTCRSRPRWSTCSQELQAAAGLVVPVHRPRPRRRASHQRPDRRDVSRQDRRGGAARALYRRPLHPYTQALLSAVPIPDPRLEAQRAHQRWSATCRVPLNPPSGCRFHTRCPMATDLCRTEEPPLRELAPDHRAACHFAEG